MSLRRIIVAKMQTRKLALRRWYCNKAYNIPVCKKVKKFLCGGGLVVWILVSRLVHDGGEELWFC